MMWTAPFDGGNAISSYTILFQDATGASLHAINDYCDGSSPTIVLQKYCDIPFTRFRMAPFNLVQD